MLGANLLFLQELQEFGGMNGRSNRPIPTTEMEDWFARELHTHKADTARLHSYKVPYVFDMAYHTSLPAEALQKIVQLFIKR